MNTISTTNSFCYFAAKGIMADSLLQQLPDRCDSSLSSDEESRNTTFSSLSSLGHNELGCIGAPLLTPASFEQPLLYVDKPCGAQTGDVEMRLPHQPPQEVENEESPDFLTTACVSAASSTTTSEDEMSEDNDENDYSEKSSMQDHVAGAPALSFEQNQDNDQPHVPEEIAFGRKKSVRFLCSPDSGRIRRLVRRLPAPRHGEDVPRAEDIWWTATQLRHIRRACAQIVNQHKSQHSPQHKQDLILAYLKLQKRTLSSEEFRNCRKRLAESYETTRGLEHHMANAAIRLQHSKYMQAVLDAQATYGQYAVTDVALIAQKESLASRQRAQRMAICDYHAAMHVYMEQR